MLATRLTRVAATAFALIAVAASTSAAECKSDTSTNRNRTLFSGISAFHVDEIGSSVRVNGQDRSTLGGEFALALCRWPAYTFGFGGGGTIESIETSYIAPGSTNFHPSLAVSEGWISVTRRWRLSDIVHPMASVRIGQITSNYPYYHRVDGISERHVDGSSSAMLVSPMAGVEVSLFKYVTAYLNAGPRIMGQLKTPGATTGSDFFASFGMAFGKMR
jgi:hypothetical protein